MNLLKKLEFTRDDIIDLVVYLVIPPLGCIVVGGICFYAGINYQQNKNNAELYRVENSEVIKKDPQPQPYIQGYIRDSGSKVR